MVLGVHRCILCLPLPSIPHHGLEKPVTKRSGFYRWLLDQTVSLILTLGRVEVQATGLEKIKDLPPFLLVANHRSNFDPFVAIASCPKAQLAYVAKPAS